MRPDEIEGKEQKEEVVYKRVEWENEEIMHQKPKKTWRERTETGWK